MVSGKVWIRFPLGVGPPNRRSAYAQTLRDLAPRETLLSEGANLIALEGCGGSTDRPSGFCSSELGLMQCDSDSFGGPNPFLLGQTGENMDDAVPKWSRRIYPRLYQAYDRRSKASCKEDG